MDARLAELILILLRHRGNAADGITRLQSQSFGYWSVVEGLEPNTKGYTLDFGGSLKIFEDNGFSQPAFSVHVTDQVHVV